MKKSKLVKTALLTMTVVGAFSLAACSGESQEPKTDSSVESLENSEESAVDDTKEIQKIARDFYLDVYSFDIEDMERKLNAEQPDILKGNIFEYNEEQKAQLAEVLSLHHSDVLPLTNYEELSNIDKADFLLYLGEIEGKTMMFGNLAKGISAYTSGDIVIIDGNKANVVVIVEISTSNTSATSGIDAPQATEEEIPVQLVKTSDGWKIDSAFAAQKYRENIESRISNF